VTLNCDIFLVNLTNTLVVPIYLPFGYEVNSVEMNAWGDDSNWVTFVFEYQNQLLLGQRQFMVLLLDLDTLNFTTMADITTTSIFSIHYKSQSIFWVENMSMLRYRSINSNVTLQMSFPSEIYAMVIDESTDIWYGIYGCNLAMFNIPSTSSYSVVYECIEKNPFILFVTVIPSKYALIMYFNGIDVNNPTEYFLVKYDIQNQKEM